MHRPPRVIEPAANRLFDLRRRQPEFFATRVAHNPRSCRLLQRSLTAFALLERGELQTWITSFRSALLGQLAFTAWATSPRLTHYRDWMFATAFASLAARFRAALHQRPFAVGVFRFIFKARICIRDSRRQAAPPALVVAECDGLLLKSHTACRCDAAFAWLHQHQAVLLFDCRIGFHRFSLKCCLARCRSASSH